LQQRHSIVNSTATENFRKGIAMIGYVTLGTNDLEKAAAFYDKLCAEMGMGRFMENDRLIAWGGTGGGAGFGIARPYDGSQ
jgi:catechol 2,3-dioxygenase-like lactoylglutathione lyase family enzyme